MSFAPKYECASSNSDPECETRGDDDEKNATLYMGWLAEDGGGDDDGEKGGKDGGKEDSGVGE